MNYKKDLIKYRCWQVFIFIAHIALLAWIVFTLQNGGSLSTTEMLIHFTGMSLSGALLIRFCAYIIKEYHLKFLEYKKNI